MNLEELARRLGATTAFSALPHGEIEALLRGAVRREVRAATLIADGAGALDRHLVLLSGELAVARSWCAPGSAERTYGWRVAPAADGPGFALLTASVSRLRVQAVSDAELFEIDSDAVDDLVGWNCLPGSAAVGRHRRIFHKLPPEGVQRLFERMTERTVAAGEAVVTQGERGDAYYVIVSGEAEVWLTDPLSDETALVNVLHDGDAFGEEALLMQGNRTATVTMKTPGRLLVLTRDDFDALLLPSMVDVIEPDAAQAMLASGQATLIDCRYPMEYEESRIPGARLVPLTTMRQEGAFALDPGCLHIVYCRGGRRSNAAAFLLRERGVRALSLRGGITHWPYEIDSRPL